jgi:hypothetical protein
MVASRMNSEQCRACPSPRPKTCTALIVLMNIPVTVVEIYTEAMTLWNEEVVDP